MPKITGTLIKMQTNVLSQQQILEIVKESQHSLQASNQITLANIGKYIENPNGIALMRSLTKHNCEYIGAKLRKQ
jgi:hypothetical protein